MSDGDSIQCKPVEVVVGDRGLERAIKHLKRKMANEKNIKSGTAPCMVD